ncbi:putative monooxygenase [Sphingobium jiangsuense]|uniref:Cation diffusion facilitator CzcD-associated flavoprotein CzcO n=1 Tax=Sphingobium jiangsuense TaxID=870476 RepID=A0A7W6BH26_9SPHN|nr:NAD(P)/FAD-dependent oxidoreductase [Sphingobium jiangsuense]MBB3926851.1 cation diffusion facilitator CzcD-associated flavoprotein CzcO [Sphingobium jiangsuense]GLS98859.1 putative monooxygenase [Sphingobium jiangsuense]
MLTAAVIGAGMAGILAAIRLDQSGIACDVYEKGDSVGGTWRENTYPGIACDVAAHWYTYNFARNPEWDSLMAKGEDIRAYFEHVASDFGVLEKIRFNDEVVLLRYDAGRWHLETASGHRADYDIVIAATGVLHHPNIPDFAGIDTFRGAVFHSARWDHGVPLDGKNIGIIGNGSTAAQLVSALVEGAKRLDLYQRTAQWVMPRDNIPYSEEEKALFRKDPAALEALIRELRSKTLNGYAAAVIDVSSPEYRALEQVAQDNLATVKDAALRERLTPDYKVACKRLVISSTFYDAIQHPNARLVTSPIERIEPEGVRTADGNLHELDVLVLATGFQVDRFIRPTRVIGPGGLDLDDVWAEGPLAYLSMSVAGFPNFFLLNGPNSPVGNFSLVEVAQHQIEYILQLVDGIRTGHYREIAATPEAMRRFEEERCEAAKKTVWVTGCDSWYLDKKGVPASWTFSYDRFVQEAAHPRMQDYETR